MSVELVSDALAAMSVTSDSTSATTHDTGIHNGRSTNHPDTSKSSLDASFQPPDFHTSSQLSTPTDHGTAAAANTTDEDDMYLIDQHNLHQMLLQDAAALHSRGTAVSQTARAHSGDAGSDSGVEIADLNAPPLAAQALEGTAATCMATCNLKRALSSTSGGYASSSGGLDEPLNRSCGSCTGTVGNGAGSCNSSMMSYCSELDGGAAATATDHRSASTSLRHSSQQDCTSEGGSESSSITGGPVHRKSSIVRKKVALIEPPASAMLSKCGRKDDNSVARSRARTASANRTALQTKCPAAPVLLAKDRARSRDKVVASTASSRAAALPPSNRSTPLKRSVTIGRQDSVQSPRTPLVARTPSITRGSGRVSAGLTPTHSSAAAAAGDGDGRWPSIGAKCQTPQSKAHSASASASVLATPEHLIIKTKVGPICLAADANGMDSKNYATLPRRRKEKSDDDLHTRMQRSTSAQRDRMSTSLIKRQLVKDPAEPKVSGRPSAVSTPSRRSTLSGIRFPPTAAAMPPAPGVHMPKTKIYHEISIQTALTGDDVGNAMAGLPPSSMMRPVDAVETESRSCQVDIRDTEIESLHEELRRAREQVATLQTAVSERGQQLLGVEQQLARERDEKLAMTQELQSNTQRILGMLALVQHSERAAQTADADNGDTDSLLMLESQIQLSGHALEAKQCEIEKLYGFCRTLQLEMQRSMSVQRSLLEEKNELEKESTELQDFLQDEKTTLVDALRDAEAETERTAALVAQREVDIERLQEECRHLVRISEQRRHEYLGMQSKYDALELRSKDLIAQQGSAVSGASMALAGLGARLDQLVEQLISSYSISEQELEDVVYHNEAYTNDSAASSADATPDTKPPNGGSFGDGSLSPQRHQSFIVAVISAIRNAASTAKHSMVHPQAPLPAHAHHQQQSARGALSAACNSIDELAGDESDTTEMLDSETEPCLMMENVLEDVSMPDTHSHNMVSSASVAVPVPSAAGGGAAVTPPLHLQLHDVACPSAMGKEEESIHNLSQAILNRQHIELQSSRLAMRTMSEHSSGSDELGAGGVGDQSVAEQPSMVSEFSGSCAQPLVDQIIGVDNLVTKLLKVLRIIQMDNDNCIQQLIGDKNGLQLSKEELLLRLHDWEQLNAKLRADLDVVSAQLKGNSGELAHSKIELQRYRSEIDRLNVDICTLSTLCQNTNNASADQQNVLHAIAQWRTENKDCRADGPHVLAQLVAACQENPLLKQQLLSNLTTSGDLLLGTGGATSQHKPSMYRNLQEAIVDTKRQYEAIDRALETLNGMQSTVQQCPALLALQRDLEETNFQSATNMPVYTAALLSTASGGDCNANGTAVSKTVPTVATGGGVDSSPSTSSSSSPGRIMRIDSTA